MRRLVAPLILALVGTAPVSAQATPEAAALEIGTAIRTADYAGAARVMHPAALRQLHELFGPIVSSAKGGDAARQLFGAESAAAFVSMPDTVVYARFLKNVMSQQAGLEDAMRTATIEALGHVAGGGDTALVVSRMTMSVEGMSISTFEVTPVLFQGGRYWGLLKADFTNMITMLRANLGSGS